MENNNTRIKTCDGCYWQDQCDCGLRCEDYAPMTGSAGTEYIEDMEMRIEAYRKLVREFKG